MSHIVIGTAGHIDHGKSSLVHALTGIDPDRLKEEKERGITIELGFAHVRLGEVQVAFIDVPGHEKFVRTMLAGVGGIDCVLLVVAADESVMPQTREHFDICRLLCVRRGLVALTKADLVDAETLEIATLEVQELVAGSFLERASIVPVSARTGQGLEDLRTRIREEAGVVAARPATGAARLPVDRVFSAPGFGSVVTGTLVSGRVNVEDDLLVLPEKHKVRVRGLQVHGRAVTSATTGQRAAVNLGGIELAGLTRGQTLAAPDTLSVTRTVEARIDLLPTAKALKQGARVRFHQGTRESLGRISLVGSSTSVEPGAGAHVRVRLESPTALNRGDRFILRAYSPAMTIGGGVVLDPAPRSPRVRSVAAVRRLETLSESGKSDDLRALGFLIDEAGPAGLPLALLTSRGGVAPDAIDATQDLLKSQGLALLARNRLVSAPTVAALSARVLGLVEEFHRDHPLTEGIPREEARARAGHGVDPDVFELVVTQLTAAGRITSKDRLARVGRGVELTAEELQARSIIESAYQAGGLAPPDAERIAAAAELGGAVVERITGLLVRQKVLTRLDGLIFHADALGRLKEEVAALKAGVAGAPPTIDVGTFKERYGVTRKYAIPLLEWLDRERVTKRVGQSRVVL